MYKAIAKIFVYTSLIAIVAMFNNCTSYYLQKVNTSFSVPNGAPNAVVKREAGDKRLSMGFGVNLRPNITFNDGNHSSTRIYDSRGYYSEEKEYEGENVKINFPQIQGSFLFDYSILSHLFIFGKGNFGYADDVYCGAINAGVGTHFRFLRMAITGYLMPGFYTLTSDAQIFRADYNNSSYFDSHDNTLEFSFGGGFKFITADTTQKIHLSWGIDAQLQKYFTFTYNDTTFANDDKKGNYWMFFITPSIGLQGTFGNSEVDIGLHLGVPAISGGGDYNDELLNEGIFPTVTAGYTYCFKRKNRDR